MSSNITLRIPKGSKLTYQEGDDNFKDIQNLFRFTEDTPVATGTADAIVVTSLNLPFSGFVDNMFVGFKASATNVTTTPTLNADGIGAIVIEREDGSALQAGDISSGVFYVARYNQSSNTYRLFGQGGGVNEFVELIDTPASYAGTGGQAVAVNVGETGLEFVPFPSAPVDSVNGQTGTVVLDYGDFAGAENISLQNNIAVTNPTAGEMLVYDSAENEVHLGNSTRPVQINGSVVPKANYGGMTYDLITTQGGQTIDGALTLSGDLLVAKVPGGLLADFSTTSATNGSINIRNSEGGLKIYVDDGGARLVQTDAAGAFLKTWFTCVPDAQSVLLYNNSARFQTTPTGASVEGTTLEVNNVSYTWPGANASGVLTNDGAGNLTWAAASGGQVNSVVGGDNITVDATDPANPIVNLNSAQTHSTFSLNTTNATGTANAITAGTNGVLEWEWNGVNTSVSLQHNGSDVLTVDENGVTIPVDTDLRFGTSTIQHETSSNALVLEGSSGAIRFGNGTTDLRFTEGTFDSSDGMALRPSPDSAGGIVLVDLGNGAGGGTKRFAVGSLAVGEGFVLEAEVDASTDTLRLGFFDATPVAQQDITGSIAAASDVANSVADALIALGLATDSRTA